MTRTRAMVAAVVAAVLLGSVIALAVSRASHPGPTALGASAAGGAASLDPSGSSSSSGGGRASSSAGASTSTSPHASPRAGQRAAPSASGQAGAAPAASPGSGGPAGTPGSRGPTPRPVPPPPPAPAPGNSSLSLPIRAAFYYPWFPQTWGSLSNPDTYYHPSLGFYNSANPSTVRTHIAAMQYGHIQAGIASWWGQGSGTDANIPGLLSAASGTGFKWAVYYEAEGNAVPGVVGSPNPTVAQISSDLSYIRTRYAGNPSYLYVNGKPVVFVYGDPTDSCLTADRWKQANTFGFYIQLKVFANYQGCASQPDAWHQYGPASATESQAGYSFSISPGFFWIHEAAPRLPRDPVTAWPADVAAMVQSHAPWQLVTTFNEWGEGTAVESATEWASASGYGLYLDALHSN